MKIKISLSVALVLSSLLVADESSRLGTIGVDDNSILDDSGIGSKSSVLAKQIKIQNSAEFFNPYKAISLEAGVDIRFNDPWGMNITHKVRGKSNRNIGETLEGLPLKGIGPGGGLATMVDIENIEAISIEKGAIKADSGFGYGSDNGMVDMSMKRPLKEFGATLKQSLGSENFTKTYLRVDSGEIKDVARFFVSASFSEADKYKGKGKGLNRKNIEFGAINSSQSDIEWEIYGIYNDQLSHGYKGLSYAQSKDLKANKNLDYQTIDRTKSDYYDYNLQDFQTYTLFGKLKIPLASDTYFTFRPYFLNDKGYSYATNGANVQDWVVDHDTYGGVVELESKLGDAKFKAGWWYQEDEPPGPPTSQKLRKPDTLEFVKWQTLVEVEKKHKFSSPFITYEQLFGNTLVEAGLKYLYLNSPRLVTYKTAGVGDGSYKDALAQANNVAFVREDRDYEIFLPNIGVTHFLDDYSSIKASYGRNWNTLAYSNYNETLPQDTVLKMYSMLKPEESDNFDIGYTYQDSRLSFNSTAFYSKLKNVGGVFYDPVLNTNISQNTAKATSYGLELSGGYDILSNLTLNASATYNRYAFTEDIRSAAASYIKTKDKQHPDVPKFFGNIWAEYDLNGYVFAPILRYLGKRNVDVEGKYSVNSYYLFDLSINKEIKLEDNHALELSLSATNLFNKKYISTFGASHINVSPEATYTMGSPRAIFASLTLRY